MPESADPDDPAVTISVQSLLDERHAVRERTLQQPTGTGQWAGNFRGARRGHGTDFDDLRHYSPGDEWRHIDWKASARTNQLHTRLYREEREHRVTLITDLRSSMFTGSRVLRSVKACRLTARLLWQAIEGGSRASVIVVYGTGLCASENRGGHRAAINACGLLARCFSHAQTKIGAQGLYASPDDATLNPAYNQAEHSIRPVSDDMLIPLATCLPDGRNAAVTIEQVAQWMIMQRQLHGTLIWISAFDSLGGKFDQAMDTLSQATRQVAIYVDDQMLEHGLPPGRYGYRAGDLPERSVHAVALNGKQSHRLQQQLLKQNKSRMERFSQLFIPLLNTEAGNADIVSALRQSGHLP